MTFRKRSIQLQHALIAAFCGFVLLALPQNSAAQNRTDSVRVYFRAAQSKFDPGFKHNREAIDAFIEQFRHNQSDPNMQVVVESVRISSSASPEGSFSLNEELAKDRQKAILDYLEDKIQIQSPGDNRTTEAIDWGMLRRLVMADAKMPQAYREEILSRLDSSDPYSVNGLKGTPAGKYLWDKIYPKMRTTSLVIVWEAWQDLELPELFCDSEEDMEQIPFDIPSFQPLDASMKVEIFSAERPKTRDIVLKLNLLALPALILNGGIELQALDYFSVNIPVWYTGLDWFSEKVKFRTFAVQPEVRYWFRRDLHGPFIGAHATLGWYNVAWGGDYRYQDHNQNTPTFGGGLNVGYKLTLGRNNDSHWGLEVGLGGGVLPLYYDIYYNVHNGRLAGEGRKTYWGIDQAFISLTYRIGQFKLKQK